MQCPEQNPNGHQQPDLLSVFVQRKALSGECRFNRELTHARPAPKRVNAMHSKTQNRMSVRLMGIGIILFALMILFELGSYLVVKYYIYPSEPSKFYEPPTFSKEEYSQYLRDRDPILGWPSVVPERNPDLDPSGSRHSPAFPIAGEECVSTYGDSYTYGAEVEHHQAWSHILSKRLNCRVANFGVGGYGTDQALIRFAERPDDSSSLVILGIFPHNVLRNVNQYRYFLSGSSRFGFKPRFVIADKELAMVPIAKLSYEELHKAISEPESVFPHEAFIPESRFGPMLFQFPYSLVLLKYATSEQVRNYLLGWPGWRSFVTAGHSSGSLEVTIQIVNRFSEIARGRGKDSLIVLFPTVGSYNRYVKSGRIAYEQLLDAIEGLGIDYIDLHGPIREYLGDKKICALLTDMQKCAGHFNPEGNEVVANTLAKWISAKKK